MLWWICALRSCICRSEGYLWVNNESFGGFSGVRYHVRDVTFLDVVLCAGVFRILRNKSSPVLQEEGNPKRRRKVALKERKIPHLRYCTSPSPPF